MKVLLYACMSLGVLSCSTHLQEYQNKEPKLLLESYFNGRMIAHGVIQDYRERLTRHFCVELEGRWKRSDNPGVQLEGVLDERFYFDDGEQQTRIWQLEKYSSLGRDIYHGHADDVIGAAKGEVVGNAFRWRYRLDIPLKNKEGKSRNVVFSVDDWIYQLDQDKAFNRAKLKKFGITLGEISIFFDKTQSEC